MRVTSGLAALALILAYLIQPSSDVYLFVAGGFAVAALLRPGYLLAGAVSALALPLLADNPVWWLALLGLAVVIGSTSAPDKRQGAVYAAAVLLGVLASAFLALPLDVAVLGAGLVVVGTWAGYQNETKGTATAPSTAPATPIISTENLSEIATRLHVTVDGLVRAAQAIDEVTGQQLRGANEQAEVIQMTNDKMGTFLALSEQVSRQTRSMTETAQQTTELSAEGQAAIRQAGEGMTQIRQQVEAISKSIVTLAQLARRIDEIITSVTEIARQSNLLALNASIEAARAGVHGRGFAIVADEVRSLSQQSTSAANQVRDILAKIQDAVRETISATEAGMQGVDSGSTMTQQADEIMMQLSANVQQSNQAARSIYDVIRNQVDGLEEVALNIERIDHITQRSLSNTYMVETVSKNLSRLADELQDAVEISDQSTQMSATAGAAAPHTSSPA